MVSGKSKCPICGFGSGRLFLVRSERKLWKCRSCGLIYVWPMPTEGWLSRQYEDKYFTFENGSRVRGYLDYSSQERFLRPYFEKKFKELRANVVSAGKIKLLDIGCALGFFLQIAKDAGWDVTGLDRSSYAIEELQKRGIKGVRGDFSKTSFDADSFDAVTLFQTIEHVTDPVKFLEQVRRVLKPRGVLLLTTPDRRALFPRIFGKNWHGWDVPGHLLWFDKKSLESVLRRAGFGNIVVEEDTLIWSSLFDISEAFGYFYPNWFTKRTFGVIKALPRSIRDVSMIPQVPLRSLSVLARK